LKQIIFFKLLFVLCLAQGFQKDYYTLDNTQKRAVFFEKMNAMLDVSFEKLAQERAFVEAFLSQSAKQGFRISDTKALERLISLKQKYRIKNLFDLKEYQVKIAPIPKSMAMAQALLESATGTSRFAKEANNLFGEWTYGEKGLVPNQRSANQKHKIKIFDSLQESVDSYVLNLNRHYAYEEFREKRKEFSDKNQQISGLEAIKSLEAYSELKEDYIKRITKIITLYKLEKYDLKPQSPFIKR